MIMIFFTNNMLILFSLKIEERDANQSKRDISSEFEYFNVFRGKFLFEVFYAFSIEFRKK